jgi:hypothetical protein
MPLSEVRITFPFEAFLSRLHESHEVCVYEAIERLVWAGAEVGLDADGLLRMLDKGKTFEELLERIESEMESVAKAA